MAATVTVSELSPTARRGVEVCPVPTDDEVVAIVSALQLATVAAPPAVSGEVPSWRFSGRWWTQPIPLRRPRPWT